MELGKNQQRSYDPSLVAILEEKDPIGKVFTDETLTRRALSNESPPALVRMIAKKIEGTVGIENSDAIKALSLFERARILSLLGRGDEARPYYEKVIESSEDSVAVGTSYNNMGADLISKDPVKCEAFYRKAIEEGYLEAYFNLGVFLMEQKGREAEGLGTLMQGLEKGVGFCLQKLAEYYWKKAGEGEKGEMAILGVGLLGKSLGIEHLEKILGDYTSRVFGAGADGKPESWREALERATEEMERKRGEESPDKT